MFYKVLLLLIISFSCQAAQDVGDIDRTSDKPLFNKSKTVAYSCAGSQQGEIISVKATSTEYIILNKVCIDNKNNSKATSTEYIILL